MLHHLAPTGSMALLLANGSMSSNTNNGGEIRRAFIQADLIECMVALPGQLFTNTQIPACIWFLTKDKRGGNGKTNRQGKTLFIDARNLGYMKDRVLRDFTPDDIKKITDTFHAWQQQIPLNPPFTKGESKPNLYTVPPFEKGGLGGISYQDQKGFCFSAELKDLEKHDCVLTPGRYVGAEAQEEDSEPFAEKMARLTAQLQNQFKEGAKLEGEIKRNLAGLGYEF